MQLHDLQSDTKRSTKKRVGRGGKRGKTSGKGMKGQSARAGNSKRPQLRDMIKKLPKRRGYGTNRSRTVNPNRTVYEVVNLKDLENAFVAGEKVTPKALLAKNLVRKQKGRTPVVKILGHGTLSKKLTVSDCELSTSAREAVTKAGGEVL